MFAQPRLASIIWSEDVKFFDASSAAKMLFLAALPGLKLLFIEPNDLRKPHWLRRRQANRPHHLLVVEVQQFADCGSRSDTRPACDVPTDVVMVRVDGVADFAFRLDAEHQRVEKILAGNRMHLRQREDCELPDPPDE